MSNRRGRGRGGTTSGNQSNRQQSPNYSQAERTAYAGRRNTSQDDRQSNVRVRSHQSPQSTLQNTSSNNNNNSETTNLAKQGKEEVDITMTKTRRPNSPEVKRLRSDDLTVLNVVRRPQTNTSLSGRSISLSANHFPFIITQQTIYQYVIDVQPELESRYMKQKLLFEHFKDVLQLYVTDGLVLFSTTQFDDVIRTIGQEPQQYRVRIAFTSEIPPRTEAPIQLYNIVFKKILRELGLKQIGRNYFDPKRPISIPAHKVELWPGYVTAIHPNAKGIMLICDITHKVLRTNTVLDILYEIKDSGRASTWKNNAIKQIVGQTVLTRYNNRTYRIDEIAWEMSPNSKFTKRTGEELTFAAYYGQNYDKQIKEHDQPLLVHRHRRRGTKEEEIIYLIPELCALTGVSETMRADFTVMKDISLHTRVEPVKRGSDLESIITTIRDNVKVVKELNQWGMEIVPEMLSIQGRVFDSEKIWYANNRPFTVDGKTGEWSSLCRTSPLITSLPLKYWILVYTSRNSQLARDFAANLTKVGIPIGFKVEKPEFVEIRDDVRDRNIITDAIRSNCTEQTQCVVCIFPGQNRERYDAIKTLCSVELGIPSQCVIQKSLSKEKTVVSVCNKIALQINCKLGGELWKLEVPLRRTMIVGIDVCHDTVRGGQSVAGFCATMNENFTKYCSLVHFQKSGQELIDGLKMCMTEALKQFFKLNNYLPSLIVVYRDGVGDGMLNAVVDHEIGQIKTTFSSFGESYKPRLAVVVVKKRIHTRLFERVETGVLRNPPPGTVVDTDCVHKDWYDFYVVSQSVRQGTVSPTHYHVVYDTTELQQEHMQKLTYKLCHLYYNWPGTIRVPAPCQYAHKIAFLVGQSLHTNPSPQLCHLLHYL